MIGIIPVDKSNDSGHNNAESDEDGQGGANLRPPFSVTRGVFVVFQELSWLSARKEGRQLVVNKSQSKFGNISVITMHSRSRK